MTSLMDSFDRNSREEPFHFAGRREELATLHKRLKRVIDSRDSKGGMALVTGVPGAGKTQLGNRFAKEAQGMRHVDVRCLAIEPEMLLSGLSLFMAIGDVLDGTSEFRKVAEMDVRTVSGGAGLGPLKGNMAKEHVRHTGEFAALLRASQKAKAWCNKVLLVTVDELQGLSADGMSPLRVLHMDLHQCPILLVGIGLQHTLSVLESLGGRSGMSRPSTHIRLGTLDQEDAQDAIGQAMYALGCPIPQQSVDALAEASLGFPQHIHGYIEGACAAVDKYDGLDSSESLKEALAHGHRVRLDYYQSRLAALRLKNRAPVESVAAAMMHRKTDRLTWLEAVSAASAFTDDGESAVENAVERGVLTVDEAGDLRFGIPSFHEYMRQRVRPRQPR